MKARLPQGFGSGGANNMNQMIKQAQKMQDEMAKKQEELELVEHTTSSGGGAVEVVITGNKIIKSIKIKPEVVSPDDIEMLEDLILAAVNESIRTVEDINSQEMEKITGGLSVPGLF